MTIASPSGGIVTHAGLQLYFESHGHGDPLLLMHGFSGSSQDWLSSLPMWGSQFQIIIPDLRGHGRSTIPTELFRHQDAASDVIALLDHLSIPRCSAVGISGGGNVLLHLASRQPHRVKAMVLVSSTPYFPAQAQPIMRQYGRTLTAAQREVLLHRHAGGDPQINWLLSSTAAFADSTDDMNLSPGDLSKIQARTLIVQGDRDPLYPVELSLEMFHAIPNSNLWIIPNAGHGPVLGEGWPNFIRTAAKFLIPPP